VEITVNSRAFGASVGGAGCHPSTGSQKGEE